MKGVTVTERLFVYGTLGPGRPNEHILKAVGGLWEAAAVKGFLRSEGWGSELGYPGIVLDSQAEKIEGFLFSSETLSDHWASLDSFEGEAYKRVLTMASLNNGATVEAYVYALNDG